MKREDDNPYQPADFTVEALPGPWQGRVWGIMILLCLALVLLLCGGCATPAEVVTTRIKYDRTAGTLDIISPKDTGIGTLKTTRHADGQMEVTLKDYRSTANEAAILAQQQTAAQQTALLQLVAGIVAQARPNFAPAPEGRREENALNVRGNTGAGAFPFSPGEPGPGGPEPGKRVTGKLAVGNPGAPALAGNLEE